MPNIRVDITPAGTPGQFKAKVSAAQQSVRVKHRQVVNWNVFSDPSFPHEATAFVQFSTDGPLDGGAANHGRHRGTHVLGQHFVPGRVSRDAAEEVGFPYTFGYELGGVDFPLLDPEIVVEGNKRKAKKAKKKAKKAPKARNAKRAPRQKTAKRKMAKRKAKKR